MKVISNGEYKNNKIVKFDKKAHKGEKVPFSQEKGSGINKFTTILLILVALSGWAFSLVKIYGEDIINTVNNITAPSLSSEEANLISGVMKHTADLTKKAREESSAAKESEADNPEQEGFGDEMIDYYFSLASEDIQNVILSQGYKFAVNTGIKNGYRIDYYNKSVSINQLDKSTTLKAIGEILYNDGFIDTSSINKAFKDERQITYDAFGGYESEYQSEDKYFALAYYLYILKPNQLMMSAQETYNAVSNIVLIAPSTSSEE